MLVERSEILKELDDLLLRSTRGKGSIAAISGFPGMGKTALLDALADRASLAGSTVLSVVSAPHERHNAFGGLTQLLHALLARLPDGQLVDGDLPEGLLLDGQADEIALSPPWDVSDNLALAARHTYRVVSEASARTHLLIMVDDVQHTDAATLFCLHHLAQRLAQLPVTLVLTRGELLEAQSPSILDDLFYQTSARRFHLGPLSREGVAELVQGMLSSTSEERLVAEVHGLSTGNPLLVRALLEEYRSRPTPASESAGNGRVSRLNADGGLANGRVFQQVVLVCLHRLGPSAVRLARCVALLDGQATTLQLCRLSGLDAELVRRYLRLLGDIGVLDGVGLRHPGVRQAVLGQMSPDELTELRHRTAAQLHDDGAPSQVVARHLLNAAPLREEWAVSVLQDAARLALTDGEAAQALRYLELARACCSGESERLSVMLQSAYGHLQLRPADSAPHFLTLHGSVAMGKMATDEALRVAEGLMFHLRFDEASELLDRQAGEGADVGEATALFTTRQLLAAEFPGLLHQPRRPLPRVRVSSTSSSELRGRHALARTLERGADEDAIALAEQVLEGRQAPAPWQFNGLQAALLVLCYADRLESARKWYEVLVGDQRRSRIRSWEGVLTGVGALISLRRGQLAEAVEQAEQARARLAGRSWNVGSALASAVLVEALTSMGDHEAAMRLLAPEPPPGLFLTRAGLHYLYARGRHYLATDKPNMAVSDFLACGTLMQRWRVDSPALAPWRLGTAEALLRMGDRERAARLFEEQRASLDPGLTRSLGMALQGMARVRPAEKQPAILLDAFRRLENVGAWYEAASVLVDLSRVYQELGETAVARQTARRAWRLARSCRAESMCQELLPTSAPRGAEPGQVPTPPSADRAEQSGFDTLSESERRVALLAAQGYANREIAERLFITVSTVEQHLTRVYRKLGIRNREQLLDGAQALSRQAV